MHDVHFVELDVVEKVPADSQQVRNMLLLLRQVRGDDFLPEREPARFQVLVDIFRHTITLCAVLRV